MKYLTSSCYKISTQTLLVIGVQQTYIHCVLEHKMVFVSQSHIKQYMFILRKHCILAIWRKERVCLQNSGYHKSEIQSCCKLYVGPSPVDAVHGLPIFLRNFSVLWPTSNCRICISVSEKLFFFFFQDRTGEGCSARELNPSRAAFSPCRNKLQLSTGRAGLQAHPLCAACITLPLPLESLVTPK